MKPGKLNGSIRRTEPDEDDIKDGITFDEYGRMEYHPDFHPNHKKPVTLEEKIYIAKYMNIDGARTVGFALGRTEKSIAQIKSLLIRTGEYKRFAQMSPEEWLSLLEGVGA